MVSRAPESSEHSEDPKHVAIPVQPPVLAQTPLLRPARHRREKIDVAGVAPQQLEKLLARRVAENLLTHHVVPREIRTVARDVRAAARSGDVEVPTFHSGEPFRVTDAAHPEIDVAAVEQLG